MNRIKEALIEAGISQTELAKRLGKGFNMVGKSSVSCPLKPSDSAPLKHSTMPP